MTLDDLSADRTPDRVVELDDEEPVLLESSEHSWAWGDRPASNDERLLDERPPHWD